MYTDTNGGMREDREDCQKREQNMQNVTSPTHTHKTGTENTKDSSN